MEQDDKGGAGAAKESPFVVIKIEVYEALSTGRRVKGGNGSAYVTKAVEKSRARVEALYLLQNALRWARVPKEGE